MWLCGHVCHHVCHRFRYKPKLSQPASLGIAPTYLVLSLSWCIPSLKKRELLNQTMVQLYILFYPIAIDLKVLALPLDPKPSQCHHIKRQWKHPNQCLRGAPYPAHTMLGKSPNHLPCMQNMNVNDKHLCHPKWATMFSFYCYIFLYINHWYCTVQ